MANGESPARGALSALLLSVAVVALAIAAAILAWTATSRLDALDAAHEQIKESVAQRLTAERFEERIDELERYLISRTNPRLEVMFGNANLDGKPLNEESPGIKLSLDAERELDKFAAALTACAASAPVWLKVQGYSSTREFENAPNSNELNMRTANLRATVVVARLVLKTADAKNEVHVRHDPWDSYDEVLRPFEDAAGFSEREQEQLNRVVYIELQDAGGCKQDV